MVDNSQQVRVDVSRVVPLFADSVMVANRVKTQKDKNNKPLSKEGHIELLFLDQLGQPPKAIVRVVVPKSTASELYNILGENIQKLDAEIKNKKLPKQPQAKTENKKPDKDYLG